MPHVWSSALARGARAAGCRYATIIHDADAHPGDATGVLNRLLRADARRADLVLALSDGVAARLSTRAAARRQRVRTLFVPAAKELVAAQPRSAPAAGQAFRVLFAGRIMDYKGLPLLVEAIEALQASGAPVRLSVLGEGPLGPLASRLDRLGAKVANRWVSEEELAQAMADHHVLVLPYLEASQSGPAAQALALGLPVVATPVGALPAQAPHGRAGLIASAVTAEAVGEALGRLIQDRELYDRIAARVWADRGDRSAERFLDALLGSLAERA
jgi:glycosyltransferase involved in cell wall biosynthesis